MLHIVFFVAGAAVPTVWHLARCRDRRRRTFAVTAALAATATVALGADLDPTLGLVHVGSVVGAVVCLAVGVAFHVAARWIASLL